MGSLCSKPSTLEGGHTVLGSESESPSAAPPKNETLEEKRERLAAAAKSRQQTQQNRGVNAANPNAGRLASQANKPVSRMPSERPDEQQVVYD